MRYVLSCAQMFFHRSPRASLDLPASMAILDAQVTPLTKHQRTYQRISQLKLRFGTPSPRMPIQMSRDARSSVRSLGFASALALASTRPSYVVSSSSPCHLPPISHAFRTVIRSTWSSAKRSCCLSAVQFRMRLPRRADHPSIEPSHYHGRSHAFQWCQD